MTSPYASALDQLVQELTIREVTTAVVGGEGTEAIRSAVAALARVNNTSLTSAVRPDILSITVYAVLQKADGTQATEELHFEVGPRPSAPDTEQTADTSSLAEPPDLPDNVTCSATEPAEAEPSSSAKEDAADAVLEWFAQHEGEPASIRRVRDDLNRTRERADQISDEEIRIAFRLANLRSNQLRQATRKSWRWRADWSAFVEEPQEGGNA